MYPEQDRESKIPAKDEVYMKSASVWSLVIITLLTSVAVWAQVGTSAITVSKQGFHTFVSVHNVLTVGSPLVVDVSLRVGAASETVQVEGSYQRIETSNATISDVVTGEQAVNLPLNGRNPLALLTLEPGVLQR